MEALPKVFILKTKPSHTHELFQYLCTNVMNILQVVLPELAMIRIAAHEESGRLVGHRVLPVLGLCPGYRHVNLRTELGLPLPASLLLLVVVKVRNL